MSVTLHTTEGDIKLQLHCELMKTPCKNFLALCASHKYTRTKIHRIVKDYIIQGGDPTSSGRKSVAALAKRLPDEVCDRLTFDAAGVVAYANAGHVSAHGIGSQFFITLAKAPHLDATCTVFASVIHGMDVVRRIANLDSLDGRPIRDVLISFVTIHANPFATALVQ